MTGSQSMTLGFMQPYFLPYPGYFELIARSDVWLVFDDAQMIRRGWVNRNRILHPTEGWQYVRVPVASHRREAPIRDILIAEPDWGKRLIAQLAHYRGSLGYTRLVDLIESVAAREHRLLLDLNLDLLSEFCELLTIPFAPKLHSELGLDRSAITGPGDWALEASRALGASRYLNPPGGRELFDRERFAQAGVELAFLEPNDRAYDQGPRPFEPGLSILDLLMHLSPEAARARIVPAKESKAA